MQDMAGNEFKEWPEVCAPNGTHSAHAPVIYDFPLTAEGQLAGEEASRGHLISNAGGYDVSKTKTHGFVYRHRRELISVLAIAVVAAAVAGITMGLRQHVDSQEVLSSCQQSVDIYQSSVERLRKTVEGAADDLQITEAQVQDSKTVTDLRTAVDKGNEKTKIDASCDASASVEDNQAADRKLTEATRDLGSKVEAILSAEIAVEHSKNARDVAVAKADLSNKINDGQNVLSTVRSNDLTARQNLSAALNEAQQVVSASNSSDSSVYTNQMNKLQDAINGFTATAISR